MKVHNFSAGPAILPQFVYEKLTDAIRDYNGTGLSILEISHRSAYFGNILNETEELLREVLSVPQDYAVLFIAGGASQHFAQIPLNLLNKSSEVSYLDTGVWASNAINEARHYGKVHVVASGAKDNYSSIPTNFHIPKNSIYFHYTSNNTIQGTTLFDVPDCPVPIVCDMSSDILSAEIDVSKYGLIYASAQKNAGVAGVSLIIIKNDLLDKINNDIPNIFNYKVLASNKSLYNTPPIFAIYATLLNLQWLKSRGGIKEIEKENIEKSSLLYNEIDRNSLFTGRVKDISQRSRMNVTFWANNPLHEQKFLEFTDQRGIVGIKQYQGYGGFRASLYNALPLGSVKTLVASMQEFEKHQQR